LGCRYSEEDMRYEDTDLQGTQGGGENRWIHETDPADAGPKNCVFFGPIGRHVPFSPITWTLDRNTTVFKYIWICQPCILLYPCHIHIHILLYSYPDGASRTISYLYSYEYVYSNFNFSYHIYGQH
jgi:hypothetical protein